MNRSDRNELSDLEHTVTLWQDRLFRFAYMRIGRREDAEDMVQEVFVALFRMQKSGKTIDNMQCYLFRSLSNACADYFRRHGEPMLSLDGLDDIPEAEADRPIHDEFMRISRMLDDLPPEQAETVRLKCYDDLTFREIAELQQIPEATVKSRYRYAIRHIQQRLKKEQYDG